MGEEAVSDPDPEKVSLAELVPAAELAAG